MCRSTFKIATPVPTMVAMPYHALGSKSAELANSKAAQCGEEDQGRSRVFRGKRQLEKCMLVEKRIILKPNWGSQRILHAISMSKKVALSSGFAGELQLVVSCALGF